MFKGKRALVTGGSRGIGRETVRLLWKLGAKVIALGKTKENLQKLIQELPEVDIIQADLSDWESTRAALSNIEPIDFLVNNAAVFQMEGVESVSEKALNEMFDINVKAVINVTQVMVQGMKKRGPGCAIVNLSSFVSQRPDPLMGIYGATKAAVDHITQCMSVDFAPYRIRVNAVNPTLVMTEKTKAMDPEDQKRYTSNILTGKLPTAEEVADAIVYLLSERASNITGTCLRLDGGLYNK